MIGLNALCKIPDKKPFFFVINFNFTFGPNLSLRTVLISPISSIKPSFFASSPDQKAPVKMVLSSDNLFPLLLLTRSTKAF
jgi:hypothetical protein